MAVSADGGRKIEVICDWPHRGPKAETGNHMARQKTAQLLLIGTWRSDKVRTTKQWVYPKRLAVAKRNDFESIFGKLVMRFTASKHYVTHEGNTRARPYRVLWSREGPTFPQIVLVYGTGTDESAQHIFFDAPDSFYVQGGKCAEFFKRVKAKNVVR